MLALVSASSYRTIYNPYSGKLDFVQTSNFTGENITAYRFIGDGSGLYNLNNSNISGSQYWYNHTAQIYADDIYVNESGDTMTGNLNMSGNNISSVSYINPEGDRLNIGDDLALRTGGALLIYNTADSSYNTMSFDGSSMYGGGYDWNLALDLKLRGTGNPSSTLEIGSGNIDMNGGNITEMSTIIGNSDNVRIGDAGTDSHSLTANDDLFVSGKLEVDASIYADGGISMAAASAIKDDFLFYWGNANDAGIEYDTTQVPNSWIFGVSADSKSLVIAELADVNYNWAHPLQSNPTLFMQSSSQSTSQWGSFSHDTQKFQIDAGGVPGRMENTTEVVSKLDVNMDLTAGADLIVGDELSDLDLLTIESNGTHIVYNSPQGLPHTFTGANVTGNFYYGEMWYHNHTATELNFAVDGVFYNLTFANSDVNGFAFNNTADSLTTLIPGKYKVGYMASGDGQNNHIYFTTILVNGIDNDRCESHRKMTAGGDIVTMVGNCFVNLVVGDEIKLATADVGGTGTGNYYSANVNLVRIGA